jgi:sensor histidine kinase YesM
METVNVANYEPADIDYGVGEIAELGNRFETMLAQNRDLVDKIYVAEIKKKNAELQALREQITPHFVYNSLQLVKAEAIFAQNREISQIVNAIANLLRYSMDNRPALVTVADEVGYIRAYLDIYRRRYLGKFDYELAVPDEMLNCTMPKMLLQPLVENALKHGLAQMKSGGCIRIVGRREDDACRFEVRDNGAGIPPAVLQRLREGLHAAEQQEGIGLFNVHQRVVLERGRGYGIVAIESSAGHFTNVVLRV